MADDPRLDILAAALGVAGASEAMPSDQLYRYAEEILGELDEQGPNATIRRLQHELSEAWGNDPADWDIARATEIIYQIEGALHVQAHLKRTFKDDELDGGWKVALTHPLYLRAQARIESLQDELKGLI